LVLVQSLNQGFMPSYGRRRDVPGAAQELRTTMTLQILLVLLIGATLMVLGPAVVGLLGSSYAGASALVPWLVLGYVFLGLYFIPMNVISLVAGRTTFVWLVTIVAAAVNLGLIVALVPSHGIKAAAIASAVGYLVLWLLTMAYARALRLELSIDWRRIVPMSTVVAGTVVVGAVLIPDHGMGWVALRAALIATLPLTLAVAAGYSPRSVVARARSLARSAPAT
jgi:O-antigen/teichoic acid export membrane protein